MNINNLENCENGHFFSKKWHWMTTASVDFWQEYVSASNQYYLTIYHLKQLFFNVNDMKNYENGHFYGNLRQKMTLNNNSFTWIFAWMCLGVKLILFDHLPPFTAVLKRQQPEKLWKWPFLWHFTAKNDTEWQQLHSIFGKNLSQIQTISVWPFATY